MSNTVNKNNVFTTFERLLLLKSKSLNIEIFLAESDGFWYVGYEYQKGGSSVGDYFSGCYPSKSSFRKTFTSRKAAINHQLRQFEQSEREVAEFVKQFRQSSLINEA